jgi:hypothetical protein
MRWMTLLGAVAAVAACAFAADSHTFDQQRAPATQKVAACTQAVASAKDALNAARAELATQLETDKKFQELKTRENAALRELERVRATKDSTAALTASAAYNRAKLERQRYEKAVAATSPIGDRERQVADATAALGAAEAELRLVDQSIAEQRAKIEERERAEAIVRDAPEITIRDIDAFGSKYAGKIVKIRVSRLGSFGDYRVEDLPGVGLRSNLLGTVVNRTEYDKWVSFSAVDTKDEATSKLFAMKGAGAEELAKLDEDAQLLLIGLVVELRETSGYALVVADHRVIEKPKR